MLGTAKGHAAIRDLFRKFQKLIAFSQHNVMNPIIEVDGNRATAEWYFLGPFTFREKSEARWLALQYKDDYVKVNGKWKYQHLRVNLRLSAPHDKGWAERLIAPDRRGIKVSQARPALIFALSHRRSEDDVAERAAWE